MFRNVSSRFGPIPHFRELNDFGTSCANVQQSRDNLVKARNVLLGTERGEHAVLDAAGVVAMFSTITRVVDLTGHKSRAMSIAARVTNLIVLARQWGLIALLIIVFVLVIKR